MPSRPWSGYGRFCPLSRALDVIGERADGDAVAPLPVGGADQHGELRAGERERTAERLAA